MNEVRYSELLKRGFKPTRTKVIGRQLPEYLILEEDSISIITKYSQDNSYSIHLATNKYWRSYEEWEFEDERFDNINSLEQLIDFLKSDETKEALARIR